MLTTLGMGSQALTTFGMGEVLTVEEQPVLRGRKKRINPIIAMLLREDEELLAIISGDTS